MPIVARDLLHGGAQTYGVMLGAFGMGAARGALRSPRFADAWRRSFYSPGARLRHGRVRRPCRDEPLASESGSALVFRSRLDGFGHAVQRWRPARRPALGSRSRAGRLSGGRSAGGIALGSWMWGSIGKRDWRRGEAADSGAALLASPLLRLVDADANGQRPTSCPLTSLPTPRCAFH